MSTRLLWDAKKFTKKQIPTIFDALNCCNHEVLLKLVEMLYLNCSNNLANEPAGVRRGVRNKLKTILYEFLHCDIVRSSGKKYAVFPVEQFVVHKRTSRLFLERRIEAQAVSLSKVKSGNFCKSQASFSNVIREVALAFKLWLGATKQCYERYMVLASAFAQIAAIGNEEDGLFGLYNERECLLQSFPYPEIKNDPAPASVSEYLNLQASNMGLLIDDVLEEGYTERLLGRVECLNDTAHANLNKQLENFSSRLCS